MLHSHSVTPVKAVRCVGVTRTAEKKSLLPEIPTKNCLHKIERLEKLKDTWKKNIFHCKSPKTDSLQIFKCIAIYSFSIDTFVSHIVNKVIIMTN